MLHARRARTPRLHATRAGTVKPGSPRIGPADVIRQRTVILCPGPVRTAPRESSGMGKPAHSNASKATTWTAVNACSVVLGARAAKNSQVAARTAMKTQTSWITLACAKTRTSIITQRLEFVKRAQGMANGTPGLSYVRSVAILINTLTTFLARIVTQRVKHATLAHCALAVAQTPIW